MVDTADEMAASALAEIANVVGTSFLNVLAQAAGERMMPTLPSVASGELSELIDGLRERTGTSGAALVRTTFRVRDAAVEADLVLFV